MKNESDPASLRSATASYKKPPLVIRGIRHLREFCNLGTGSGCSDLLLSIPTCTDGMLLYNGCVYVLYV